MHSACMHAESLLSCPTLCNPMDYSPPLLSMEFSRQEHWSGLPCPLPGDLPDPGIEPMSPVSPALQADSLPAEPSGKPKGESYWVSQVVLVVKNPPANAGNSSDMGSISGSGRSPGGGNGNPLQYSCLGNPMDIGAWRATVHRVT